MYTAYTRIIFIIKFLTWRKKKLIYLGKSSQFDWDHEIPKLIADVKDREKLLFEDLDKNAEKIFIHTTEKKGNAYFHKKLSLKNIKWK